jgi:hypothetical protein
LKTFQKETDRHLEKKILNLLTNVVKRKVRESSMMQHFVSQIFKLMQFIVLPNRVVVYVACRNKPADNPVYRVRKPSFLTTPIRTDIEDGLERSDTTQTCILFLTRSSGWTKQVAAIL